MIEAPGDRGAGGAKARAGFDDLGGLDSRVGRVVAATPFPRAREPSDKDAVDSGSLGGRWSGARIAGHTVADPVGTDAVGNFAPRGIAGFGSESLILDARGANADVVPLSPRSDVPRGSAVPWRGREAKREASRGVAALGAAQPTRRRRIHDMISARPTVPDGAGRRPASSQP